MTAWTLCSHRAPRWIGGVAVAWGVSLAAGCAVWTGNVFHGKQLATGHSLEVTGAVSPGAPSQAAVVEDQPVTVESEPERRPPADYRVGPGDVLFINAHGVAELSSAMALMAPSQRPVIGTKVDGSGRIQLPVLNTVTVAGLTAVEIQQKLQVEFSRLVANPWVIVEILEYRSQPVYLVGQFRSPKVIYLDRPTNLMQALALGGGFTDRSDIRSARLHRDGRIAAVDIYRLLQQGDMTQNVWLRPNDTIYVPDTSERLVFMLGSLTRAGAIPFPEGGLTLTRAIAAAGGYIRVGGAMSYVRIIRSQSPTRGELLVVDVNKILRGEALDFPLQAGDIVFVPRSNLGTWNDTLAEILPTLQLLSNLMQPFVSARYLANN